jgi:hypothetical protein
VIGDELFLFVNNPRHFSFRHSLHGAQTFPFALCITKLLFFLFSFSGCGETESTWYVGHCLPVVPAPDER